MDSATVSATIECYIVVPPHYRPQLHTGVNYDSDTNLRAAVQFTERVNENLIPLAGGRTDVFQLGPVRKDILLDITGSGADTELVLDEIIERNIPVYIYPRAGGGVQLSVPLNRGLGTDPLSSPTMTHTFTTSTGTTVYMPRADSSRGVYLEELDTTLPLVDSVYSSASEAYQLPTGRGIPVFKKRQNRVLNSLISSITYEAPYTAGSEWAAYTSAADVWGTDHGIKSSPWCADANSYWTKSSTTHLRSYTFSDFIYATIEKSLSFCYRVDGVMNISIKDSGGTTRYSVNVTSGSGRAMVDLTGIGVSYNNAYMQISLTSGSYCEFSCPQLVDNDSALDSSQYHPFLGTTSGTTEAEITGCSIRVSTIDCGADSVPFSTAAADRDGAMLVSGYFQAMFDDDYISTSQLQTIVEAEGYDHKMKLNFGYDGSTGLEFALYFDGSERAVDAVTGNRRGDIYAFGIWSGYADGTAATEMRIVRLRDGAVYTGTYADSMITCNVLYIGSDSASAQSDCVMSGVTIEAMDHGDCDSAVDRLADATVRNVFRNSWGRWYKLSKNTSPKSNGEGFISTGTYSGTEVRSI